MMHLQVLFAALALGATVLAAIGKAPLWVGVFFLALIALVNAIGWHW